MPPSIECRLPLFESQTLADCDRGCLKGLHPLADRTAIIRQSTYAYREFETVSYRIDPERTNGVPECAGSLQGDAIQLNDRLSVFTMGNDRHRRGRYSVFVTLLGSLLTLATHQASASEKDSLSAANYLHPQTLVEVERGRRLNLLCIGRGSPTVLLDSGLGDSSLTWREVQAALAKRTRVCAFDRAGYGFSDEATRPSTAQAAVDDMAALVDRASLGPKVVLVAHSLGGEQALLFALEKPDAVAGMVLVDPAYPGQPQTGDEVEQLANNRSCLRAAQANLLGHDVQDSLQHCLDSPPNSDAALHDELNRQWSRVQNNAARLSEAENLHLRDDHGQSENDRELLAHWHSLRAMPLIVLSAGTVWTSTPSLTSAEAGSKWAEHIKGHQRLAALSSRGRDIVVPDTTHYIQQIKPRIVIEAVEEVTEQIRGGAGSGTAAVSRP